MKQPITYFGCRTDPRELASILEGTAVATAANDSDAYRVASAPTADVVPITKPH